MSEHYQAYYEFRRYLRPVKILTRIAFVAAVWVELSALAQIAETAAAIRVGQEIGNLPMTGAALAVAGIAAIGMILVTKWAFSHISDSLRLQGATNERLAHLGESVNRVARAMESKPCIAINPIKAKSAFEES